MLWAVVAVDGTFNGEVEQRGSRSERTNTIAFVVSSNGGMKVVRRGGDQILLDPKALFTIDEDLVLALRHRARIRIT